MPPSSPSSLSESNSFKDLKRSRHVKEASATSLLPSLKFFTKASSRTPSMLSRMLGSDAIKAGRCSGRRLGMNCMSQPGIRFLHSGEALVLKAKKPRMADRLFSLLLVGRQSDSSSFGMKAVQKSSSRHNLLPKQSNSSRGVSSRQGFFTKALKVSF